MQIKLKICKSRYIAFNITKRARVSMLDKTGTAFDLWVHAGRALEKGMLNLRAYQLHFLWFHFSYWRTNCSPLQHGYHLDKDD